MLLYRYLSGDLLHPRESQLTWARPRRRPGSIGTVPGELSSKNGPHEKQHKNIDIRNNKTVCIGKCVFVSLTSKRNCFTTVTGNQFQKRTPAIFVIENPPLTNWLSLSDVVSMRGRLCLRCRAGGPREPPSILPLSSFSHGLVYLARGRSALSALRNLKVPLKNRRVCFRIAVSIDFLIGRLGLPTAGENDFSKTNQQLYC